MVGRDELQAMDNYLKRINVRDWIGVPNCTMQLFCGANIGSLSNHVLERSTSTGSGLFELVSCDFEQIPGKTCL